MHMHMVSSYILQERQAKGKAFANKKLNFNHPNQWQHEHRTYQPCLRSLGSPGTKTLLLTKARSVLTQPGQRICCFRKQFRLHIKGVNVSHIWYAIAWQWSNYSARITTGNEFLFCTAPSGLYWANGNTLKLSTACDIFAINVDSVCKHGSFM